MSDPIWLKRVWMDAIHIQKLQRFGGLYGMRDEGVVESALARLRKQRANDNATDIATLAAAYGFGLTRGHGYVDGNTRVGFVAMAVFLDLNGWNLEAPEPEVVRVMLAAASGELGEASLASWVREHIQATNTAPE